MGTKNFSFPDARAWALVKSDIMKEGGKKGQKDKGTKRYGILIE